MKRHLLRFIVLCVMSVFTLSASAVRGGTPDYLCFTANEAGSTVAISKIGTPTDVSIEYSTDGATWYEYTFGNDIALNSAGDKVYFRNAENAEYVTGFSLDASSYYNFAMTGSIAASGNVMSLVDQSCKTTTIPCDYCFCYLFDSCSSLTSAPTLPATTLAQSCYHGMFFGCTKLTVAPELPATAIASHCYDCMFYDCSGLATAPEELPATTLAIFCYQRMFQNCTSLTAAPKLPATTLASYCYNSMFYGCTKLTAAPKLPATTLASYCYSNMFNGCTKLTAAPEELPATTLALYCYQNMFIDCSDLTSAPKELPATTLANNCYQYMFKNCTSLTAAPTLPATKLAQSCYHSMFFGCTKLTAAPELPATTLASSCYAYMFNSCTSLSAAPELPATTLIASCYNYMFYGCKILDEISVAFTSWSSSRTGSWFSTNTSENSSSGTFSCPSGLTVSYGKDLIPLNDSNQWTVKNSYDLTITDAGWASMCVNLPLQIPTGIEVYYASAASGSQITLTQIEAGTTIAAKTAVLVKGTGTVSFPIMGEAGTAYSGNLFAGTSVDKAFSAEKDGNVYVLSGVGTSGNPQFQNYVGTKLGAHKIWLPASAVGGSSAKELNFVIGNEADGIHNAEFMKHNGDDTLYNLNGMRVGKDYKGIMIMNGKKVINK